ncbi:16S rRNA (cytidine(1402)-2'-O)-methyltransferase [Micrococcus lylae]|uniref:16S rRNA (cytidine(1402)-2'-O)-methyltransferase n=1 Tax=Micrococcus TaxID=1269 RepID=UPI0008A1EEB0|nr:MULTISPECIES: 16S rRNA (cytidine(1402)-2'-O)-methyltransferase [Micrococcus]MCT2006369.1 16S rRNA (cytidine(1402)-2'-O)-methyltransferase [Micrococcus lylae]MCT2070322.1 16S rRNA (cytidine(1402)-2'-O)-methyltransferase [Micrococcus lylae]OFR90789.1 rRNA (cytidine-2'-O-)-methyltransferase [Micrococcus sp. HMSC067E09]
MTGQLILAATPIGNLGDATDRLREVLATADVVAAEDTRMARQLCRKLGVTPAGRLMAHHEHNEAASAQGLLALVRDGATVAVVTDAGMPTVSDPGHRLVAAAAAEGLAVTCAPGASAVTTALALSGLPTDRFAFDGFVPRKAGERTRAFEQIRTEQRTVVFFESPQRITAALESLVEVLGADRPACVARELTKLHEQIVRGTVGELLAWARERQAGEGIRGEIVLVVGPGGEAEATSLQELVAVVEQRVADGERMKQAAAEVAAAHGVRKNELYDAVLAARKG